MIGGVIIKTEAMPDRVRVWVEEEQSTSKCIVDLELCQNSLGIQPSDSIWWQNSKAYWTPFDHSDIDVAINKIGFSRRA
jgi:hypothetical protein